jgi:UDP-glucose 4-epimerase
MSHDRTALVTGGAGFIGSNLVDALVAGHWQVKIIDNLATGRLANLEHHLATGAVEFFHLDLKDFVRILEPVSDADLIFHFAANPEVRLSTTEPRIHFQENVIATFNLLEAIRQKSRARRLIFASTSAVYGEPKDPKSTEESALKPVSVYGASKVCCEALMQTYARLYGIRSACLRFANIIGFRMKYGVIWDFAQKLLRNRHELEILGDGKQVRSYLDVSDAVKAILTIVDNLRGEFESYNVGNKDWLSVDEVADLVVAVIGSQPKRTYRPVLDGVGWMGDIKRIAMSTVKIEELGYVPAMTSGQAVTSACGYCLHQLKGA